VPGRHRGTGSYGAGLARHIAAAGIRVIEVDSSDRQDRRRAGKSDPLHAVIAARAALANKRIDGSIPALTQQKAPSQFAPLNG
jgi:hypothetical protein